MKQDNKKALYESIMASVAREVKKTLNEDYNEQPKSLEQILQELLSKYDKKEMSAENIIDAIRKQLNSDEVLLVDGSWRDGKVVLQYKGQRVNVKIKGKYLSQYSKEQGFSVCGILVNDEPLRTVNPEFCYLYIDKDGVRHNTVNDWKKLAVKEGNIIALPWKNIAGAATVKAFIKEYLTPYNHFYK